MGHVHPIKPRQRPVVFPLRRKRTVQLRCTRLATLPAITALRGYPLRTGKPRGPGWRTTTEAARRAIAVTPVREVSIRHTSRSGPGVKRPRPRDSRPKKRASSPAPSREGLPADVAGRAGPGWVGPGRGHATGPRHGRAITKPRQPVGPTAPVKNLAHHGGERRAGPGVTPRASHPAGAAAGPSGRGRPRRPGRRNSRPGGSCV